MAQRPHPALGPGQALFWGSQSSCSCGAPPRLRREQAKIQTPLGGRRAPLSGNAPRRATNSVPSAVPGRPGQRLAASGAPWWGILGTFTSATSAAFISGIISKWAPRGLPVPGHTGLCDAPDLEPTYPAQRAGYPEAKGLHGGGSGDLPDPCSKVLEQQEPRKDLGGLSPCFKNLFKFPRQRGGCS